MNEQPRRPLGPQPWETVRGKLDQSIPFANMRDTPYYRDCVWEQFSKQEYDRRYAAVRDKMREAKLDAIIAPGGPSGRRGCSFMGIGSPSRVGKGAKRGAHAAETIYLKRHASISTGKYQGRYILFHRTACA